MPAAAPTSWAPPDLPADFGPAPRPNDRGLRPHLPRPSPRTPAPPTNPAGGIARGGPFRPHLPMLLVVDVATGLGDRSGLDVEHGSRSRKARSRPYGRCRVAMAHLPLPPLLGGDAKAPGPRREVGTPRRPARGAKWGRQGIWPAARGGDRSPRAQSPRRGGLSRSTSGTGSPRSAFRRSRASGRLHRAPSRLAHRSGGPANWP